MSNLEARVAELESRLKGFEAEREILRTLHQYGHAWDYGPHEAVLDCFTDDGVFHLAPQRLVNSEPWTFRGRAELYDNWISAHEFAPVNYLKHVLVEPKITLLNDAEATVHSMWALWSHRDGVPHIAMYGRYIDRMAKCADGRWRLTERTAELEASDLPPGG